MAVVEELHRAKVHPAALKYHGEKAVQVEVDVGDGGEERLLDERLDLGVGLAEAASVVLVGRQPLQPVEQDFLEALDVGILAADTDIGAGGAAKGLFALVAEHGGHRKSLQGWGGAGP